MTMTTTVRKSSLRFAVQTQVDFMDGKKMGI